MQVPTPHACIQLLSLPSVCWPQLDRGALQQELASLAHLLPTYSHIGSAWPSRQPPGQPLSAAGMLQALPPPGSFSRFFGEAGPSGDPLLLPSRGTLLPFLAAFMPLIHDRVTLLGTHCSCPLEVLSSPCLAAFAPLQAKCSPALSWQLSSL